MFSSNDGVRTALRTLNLPQKKRQTNKSPIQPIKLLGMEIIL